MIALNESRVTDKGKIKALLPPTRASGRACLGDGAKTVRFDFERNVDQVVVVFDGVEPGDLDDLPFAEVLAQRREGCIRDPLVTRGFLDVSKRGAFAIREERARAVFHERF